MKVRLSDAQLKNATFHANLRQKRVKVAKNVKKAPEFKKVARIAKGARARGAKQHAPVERHGVDARWCGRELAACKLRSPSGSTEVPPTHAAKQLYDRPSIGCPMPARKHQADPCGAARASRPTEVAPHAAAAEPKAATQSTLQYATPIYRVKEA